MSLRGYSKLLHFSIYEDSFRDVPTRWRLNPIWLNITYSKRKIYTDKFRRSRIYDSRQTKITDICDIDIRYLQKLRANIIFGHNDSQNVSRKAELFLIWYTLTGTHADTKIFIIRHLLEVVNTIHKNEIGAGGIITAIAQALKHGGQIWHL